MLCRKHKHKDKSQYVGLNIAKFRIQHCLDCHALETLFGILNSVLHPWNRFFPLWPSHHNALDPKVCLWEKARLCCRQQEERNCRKLSPPCSRGSAFCPCKYYLGACSLYCNNCFWILFKWGPPCFLTGGPRTAPPMTIPEGLIADWNRVKCVVGRSDYCLSEVDLGCVCLALP